MEEHPVVPERTEPWRLLTENEKIAWNALSPEEKESVRRPREYFRNSMGPLGKCLSDSRIDERNVHDVVLVGGSTRIKFLATEALHGVVVMFSAHTETVLLMNWEGGAT